MIAKEIIKVELVKPFSLRERYRVLIGNQLKMTAYVEITARANIRNKEVKIKAEMKHSEAVYGVPQKAVPAPTLPGPNV